MIGSLSLQGNAQLYSRIAVDADELVMLQLDDIAALLCKQGNLLLRMLPC